MQHVTCFLQHAVQYSAFAGNVVSSNSTLTFSCDTCLSKSQSCSFIFTGIKTVLVGLLAQKAEVKFDKKRITSDEIICHVKELGFGCDLMDKVGQGESTVDITVSVMYFLVY